MYCQLFLKKQVWRGWCNLS